MQKTSVNNKHNRSIKKCPKFSDLTNIRPHPYLPNLIGSTQTSTPLLHLFSYTPRSRFPIRVISQSSPSHWRRKTEIKIALVAAITRRVIQRGRGKSSWPAVPAVAGWCRSARRGKLKGRNFPGAFPAFSATRDGAGAARGWSTTADF